MTDVHFRNADVCIEVIEKIKTMYIKGSPSEVALSDAIKVLEEIQKYRAIGTVEECRAAVEKQKPKKPIDRCMYKECPACGSVEIQNCGYCTECGQKLDWSDGE